MHAPSLWTVQTTPTKKLVIPFVRSLVMSKRKNTRARRSTLNSKEEVFTPHFYLPWLIIHIYPKWTFFVHSNYLHVVIALPRSLEERERAIQIEQVEEHESHFRASPPILQNARWIILTISSSQLVCNPGDPPMTCTQGDKTLKKQKQDKSHWHLGNRRGIRSLSFVV